MNSPDEQPENFRDFFAFIAATFAPGISAFLFIVARAAYHNVFGHADDFDRRFRIAFSVFIISLPISFLTTVFFGRPSYYFLKKWGMHNIVSYFYCGALIGLCVRIIWCLPLLISDPSRFEQGFFNLTECFGFMSWGAIATCVFWAIARPDLHKKMIDQLALTASAAKE